jgi:DNA primase
MPRVPEEEIQRLKREISLERLVEARGVKLTKSGGNLIGLCPLHDDKHPSLVVDMEKNLWHCLGACQAGGSVIDWVMKSEGVSFRHAVERLRNGAPPASSKGPEAGPPPKQSTVKKLALGVDRNADEMELLGAVADVYHATLKESPEALAYLERRGLVHPEMIERFRLGYANRTLGYRLPDKNRKEGAEIRGRLTEVGVYRESGHEHLSGSLVIPLFDSDGRVVNLYGRKIMDHLRPGTPLHLYLPGAHRGVFNREAFGACEELILCEALIDALTFWCAGHRNVTAAYGVEGFTDEIARAIADAGVRVVRIAFDRDEAGDRGAEKVSAQLEAMGIETYRVLFPRGMDANEYAMKVGPAEKSLGLVVRQAEWMRRGAAPATESAASSTAEETSMAATSSPAEENTMPEASAETTSQSSAPIPSLAASSESPVKTAKAEEKGEDTIFRFADRKWRVRVLSKEGARAEMKVNVLVSREDGHHEGFFVDTVDLYSARQRAAFLKAASAETELDERVLTRELGAILLQLEEKRDAKLEALMAPKPTTPAMTDDERDEALALLRDPRLMERIVEDLERAGIVGEETNKLVAYVAATSRKLEEPLAIVIQSSSAAGKSSLMEAVLALMPEEERVQYSAMTGQSLFYMSGENLKHKVLAIVEEEGAERASYALKLLQSEGELTIASTGKDPATGRLVTQTYRVEGPVMIFLTTTATLVDEELLNRCIVLAVDEGREQTRAIHAKQREAQTLEGLLAKEERQRIRRVHRNAQRLLRPLFVVNPFARELRFADHVTRTRRDHMKYLTLIRAVALLHQYQRPVKTAEHRGKPIEYIEATREDIAIANRLAHGVLGRSLDELPPQTRRLLDLVHAMVKRRCEAERLVPTEVRFSRREVREEVGWSAEQLRVHMGRLVELEYVLVHRGRRGQSFDYELAYEGQGEHGGRFLLGIEGVETYAYDGSLGGRNGELPGSNRPQTGPKPVGYRATESTRNGGKQAVISIAKPNGVAKAHPGSVEAASS